MTDPCDHCPCPGICLRREVWCREWAPSGDPVLRSHICARSGRPRPIAGEASSAPAAAADLAKTIRLVGELKACPYRSTEGCGCGGARCGLRGGGLVDHLVCLDCLRRYG